METDNLVTLLAADTGSGRPVWPDLAVAALGPVFVAGSVFLMTLGIRPDLFSAVLAPMVVWKWLLPGFMVASGIFLALTLSRPESRPIQAWLVVFLAAAFGAALFTTRAVVLPPTEWLAAIKGHTMLACLVSIIGLGLTGLIGGLAVLRRGASTRPGLSGLAIGLGSGGAAAFLYALHCNQDDPMFYVTWYGSAIVALGLIGAVLGRVFLRM